MVLGNYWVNWSMGNTWDYPPELGKVLPITQWVIGKKIGLPKDFGKYLGLPDN
jgi:hypothetical protein